IEHWDGTAWVVQPSPNVGSNLNALSRVTAPSGTDAWAVGDYYDTAASHTPTLRTVVEACWEGARPDSRTLHRHANGPSPGRRAALMGAASASGRVSAQA